MFVRISRHNKVEPVYSFCVNARKNLLRLDILGVGVVLLLFIFFYVEPCISVHGVHAAYVCVCLGTTATWHLKPLRSCEKHIFTMSYWDFK